jgi:hypothetical protein
MLNVHLRITDAATDRPTPVRVRIGAPDGTQFPPLGWSAEFPLGRNEDVGGRVRFGRESWWYVDGACEVPLPAGVALRVQVAKGPEFTPLDETVTLGAGQIALRFAVTRWADARAEGWVSVDTRCHFIGPHAALLEARAEGVDVVNLLATPFTMLALDGHAYTTAPHLLAFSGQGPALERDGSAVVVNTFNAHPVLGRVALLNAHRPVFPLAFGGEETDDWGVCDWCDQCHRKKGLAVWVGAFEPAGGLTGGEALVAAVLGKIDAIEVTEGARKVPLFPWVYRLWDAGVPVPLVGASGKDANKIALGCVRTYANVNEAAPSWGRPTPPTPHPAGRGEKDLRTAVPSERSQDATPEFTPSRQGGGWGVGPFGGWGVDPTATRSWIEAVRAGRTFVTAGPLLGLAREGTLVRATARARGHLPAVEIVANGAVIAAAAGSVEAVVTEPGWVAARSTTPGAFAHTSPLVVGTPARNPEAVALLIELIGQVRAWAEERGRFASPKRKAALLERCADAVRRLEGAR